MQVSIREIRCDKLKSVTLDRTEVASFSRHTNCQVCDAPEPWRIVSRLGRVDWEVTMDIGEWKSCGVMSYVNPPGVDTIDEYYKSRWNSQGERKEGPNSDGLTTVNK